MRECSGLEYFFVGCPINEPSLLTAPVAIIFSGVIAFAAALYTFYRPTIWARKNAINTTVSEIRVMEKHFRDNVGVLMLIRGNTSLLVGRSVDYEKFEYGAINSSKSLLLLKPEDISLLPASVSESFSRLMLFQRNTQFHIRHAIIFFDTKNSDYEKVILLDFIIRRMVRTWDACSRLRKGIEELSGGGLLKSYLDFSSLDKAIPRMYFSVEVAGDHISEEAVKLCRVRSPSVEQIEEFAKAVEFNFGRDVNEEFDIKT